MASHPDKSITTLDRGKAVNEILLRALRKLRPEGNEPKGIQVPPREWFPYFILNDSYVSGRPTREIMARLCIGEGTYNRMRRRALHSVAKALVELEQQVNSRRTRPTE